MRSFCRQGNVWVWCESNYGVAAFYEFTGQLTWDKWEVLLDLLWCDTPFVSDLLVMYFSNVFISNCGWGGWWVGHCDLLRWVGRSFVLERACVWEGFKSSKDGKAPWVCCLPSCWSHW